MSEWVRNTKREEAYEELHGIKPEVYYLRVNSNEYKVKLIGGGKEIIITEKLDRGDTKEVTLEYNGNKEDFMRVFKAEKRANEIMGG